MTPLISPPRGLRVSSINPNPDESTVLQAQRLLARILEGGERPGAVSQALQRGYSWETAVQFLPAQDRAQFSPRILRTFSVLSRVSNRSVFHEELLALGRKLENSDPPIAARIYSVLDAIRDWSPSQVAALQANQRLEVLRGGGGFSDRVERFASSFISQVTDPTALIGIGVAGMAYRGVRLAVMSRLAAQGVANFPRAGLALASLAGFAAEVPAFSLSTALVNTARGHSVDWSAGGVATSLGHGALMLGSMRLSDALASGIGRRIFGDPHLSQLSLSSRLGLGASQQLGMFGGILTSQQLEIMFGLRPAMSWRDRLSEGLANSLIFNATGHLARAIYGRRWASFERDIEIQTRRLAEVPNSSSSSAGIGRIPPEDLPPPLSINVRAPEVPGPKRLIPILATFAHVSDPIATGRALLQSGLKIRGLARGHAGMVLINDAELTRDLMTQTDNWARISLPLRAPASLSYLDTMSVSSMFLKGPSYQWRRRILVKPLSNPNNMTEMTPAFELTLNEITQNWLSTGSMDLIEDPMRISLRNNMRTLMGIEPAAGEAIADQMKRYLGGFLSPGVMATKALGLGRVIPGTPYARWLATAERLNSGMSSLIESKRSRPTNDALSILMSSVDEETGNSLTNDEIIGEFVTFYGAGQETTARTMGWAMWLLAHHPTAARQAAQEVADVLQGRTPTYKDLKQLRFLDNVINETQRIMPIAPSTLPRTSAREMRFGGILLPKGSNVAVSIYAQHHDPAVFPRPGTFLPERWENAPNMSPYQFIPFGAGPRRCIGGVFAAWQVRATMAMLLQRYSFQPTTSHVDYSVVNATLRPRGNLSLRVLAPGNWRESPPLTGTITKLVYP